MNAPLATVGAFGFRAAVSPNWALDRARGQISEATQQLRSALFQLEVAGVEVTKRQELAEVIEALRVFNTFVL